MLTAQPSPPTAARPLRWRAFIPLLLPAVLLACWLKILLTPAWCDAFDFKSFNRGWPWVFFESATIHVSAPAPIPPPVTLFYFWQLAADLAIMSIVVGGFYWLTVRYLCRRENPLQISLRGLLILVALVGSACGWFLHEYRAWQADNTLAAEIGELTFPLNTVPDSGPIWLKRLTGNDRLFDRICCIRTYGLVLDESSNANWKSIYNHFPHLPKLRIEGTGSLEDTDTNFTTMLPFDEIELSGLDDKDFHLDILCKLPKLRRLSIETEVLNDRQIEVLLTIPHLERLTIYGFCSPQTVSRLKKKIETVIVEEHRSADPPEYAEPSEEMMELLRKQVQEFFSPKNSAIVRRGMSIAH